MRDTAVQELERLTLLISFYPGDHIALVVMMSRVASRALILTTSRDTLFTLYVRLNRVMQWNSRSEGCLLRGRIDICNRDDSLVHIMFAIVSWHLAITGRTVVILTESSIRAYEFASPHPTSL